MSRQQQYSEPVYSRRKQFTTSQLAVHLLLAAFSSAYIFTLLV
jgi:hypothetical protein